MGVRVVDASPEGVTLEAPLAPNLNHRSTAFGGSVAALAILAGWTLLHLRLRSDGVRAQIVIQASSVRYEAPIRGAFRATCGPVEEASWRRLERTLARWGKGRLSVSVSVEDAGGVAATFEGAYVALAERPDAR